MDNQRLFYGLVTGMWVCFYTNIYDSKVLNLKFGIKGELRGWLNISKQTLAAILPQSLLTVLQSPPGRPTPPPTLKLASPWASFISPNFSSPHNLSHFACSVSCFLLSWLARSPGSLLTPWLRLHSRYLYMFSASYIQ